LVHTRTQIGQRIHALGVCFASFGDIGFHDIRVCGVGCRVCGSTVSASTRTTQREENPAEQSDTAEGAKNVSGA
jgi:hypothetical protein